MIFVSHFNVAKTTCTVIGKLYDIALNILTYLLVKVYLIGWKSFIIRVSEIIVENKLIHMWVINDNRHKVLCVC